MDDEFLYGLRQPPPPEFAAALKRRLRATRVGLVLSQRVLNVAACVAVFAVAASVLANGSVRESSAFGKFASVGGYVNNLVRTASLDLSQVFGDRIDFVKDGEIRKGVSENVRSVQSGSITPGAGRATSTPCEAGQTLGPAVGRLLREAILLVKSGKYAEALALAREADRVPNKTAFEACTIGAVITGIEYGKRP